MQLFAVFSDDKLLLESAFNKKREWNVTCSAFVRTHHFVQQVISTNQRSLRTCTNLYAMD